MESSRHPRFKRVQSIAPICLTERDRDILRLVQRHRFLRSWQIVALIDGSSQQLLRRLQLLFHHGYLERPRAQLNSNYHSGPRHIIYGLGNKGGTLLYQQQGTLRRNISWGEKNRDVRGIFLEHAVMVSDVMVAIELACREKGNVRFLMEEQILAGRPRPLQWRVNIKGGLRLGVVPDHVFALEFPDQSDGSSRIYYFVEADRGTMPVTRQHLAQTSFYRKLLAYEATWSQSIPRRKFGIHRFRVLTVTTGAARIKTLVEACSRLEKGHGLFLFTDIESLQRSPSILNHEWQTASPGVHAALLD